MKFFFLITGTRELTTVEQVVTVRDVFHDALEDAREICLPKDMAIIHGDCPSRNHGSVDQFLGGLAKQVGIQPIEMPYNGYHGRAGGPMRNKAMVIVAKALACSGIPHIALAFPRGESIGTRGCIELIQLAGLDLRVTEI